MKTNRYYGWLRSLSYPVNWWSVGVVGSVDLVGRKQRSNADTNVAEGTALFDLAMKPGIETVLQDSNVLR